MKNLVILNKEVVNEIEDMVCNCLGFFDEYTYSDALFIVEFALGMKKGYTPEDYMYDIFNHFGIVEGYAYDEEIIRFLVDKHLEHGEDEWGDSMVICDLKEWLDQR